MTPSKRSTAEQRIMKDLIDALIAEHLLILDELTTSRLGQAPAKIQDLYPEAEESDEVYVGAVCLLVEPSYRQGKQWMTGTRVYRLDAGGWTAIDSPSELGRIVLRSALPAEAYAHPGVTEFIEGLETAVLQFDLSPDRVGGLPPQSAYDWHVLAEKAASLRDRPFHPLSKAKIGFTLDDYGRYMAEFSCPVVLRWVAVRNDSIAAGCPDGGSVTALDALAEEPRAAVEQELKRRDIATDRYTVIPVHPWQLDNVIRKDFETETKAGTIVILDTQAGEYYATSSLRSMAPASESTLMLKLPVSVKSLGAARYLPVVKLLNGLAGEKMFRQAIACDETLRDRVLLCEEKHWWGYMPQTMGLFDDHPRHLAAQVRVYPQQLLDDRYRIVPMASLGVLMAGEHLLTEIMGGAVSQEEAVQFYADLAETFYDIVMRLFKVGIVPEIHGQNCCLVLKDGRVFGLLFRDHDSVRLHRPYLDKHGIEDPCYHIRPGYSNSLYNETIEKLVFYVQSLGTQVNLASIMEAMAEAYAIAPGRLWAITESKLEEAVRRIDVPERDRTALLRVLFESETWPTKLIVRPLLEADGVPGAMPSGKGLGPNPFRIRRLLG